MAKYRGKYVKCRECKHSERVMMWMVKVKETCPKGMQLSCMRAVDKPTCEDCEYFEMLGKE